MMKHKCIFIAGGTGSWARGVIRELLNRNVKKIRIFARNEYQMVKMLQEFDDSRMEAVIGDIRDRTALQKACRGSEIIFHLAALKHVPICENMPFEAIETNVIGTENIINCAIEEHVEKVIYVSTDKAVNVNSTYGCTKLLGEKLMLSAASQQSQTKFIVFRGGNLLGSAGSVLPLFKKQIEESGILTLTDEKMSRFFITVERASRLLAEAACRGAGGEIFLPVMPSLYIKDIAKYLLKQKGYGEDSIRLIGLRPGEKTSEQLLTDSEISHLYELDQDLVLVSEKDHHGWVANDVIRLARHYSYSSDQRVLTYEQTEQFLHAANL